MPATIRPATVSEVPRIASFLAPRLGGAGGAARYQRYLEYRWSTNKPDVGILIEEDDEVRGFIGAIYAERQVHDRMHRFCNLTSIAVDESHRRLTLQAFGMLFKQKDTTFTCFSASDQMRKILDFFKFHHRPSERVMVPLISLGLVRRAVVRPRLRVFTRDDEIDGALDSAARRIARDHRGYGCAQLVLERGGRRCHVIAARRGRGVRVFAEILHASDHAMLIDELAAVQPTFLRNLGTVLVGIDRRWVRDAPWLSFVYTGLRPTYARSPILAIDEIDGLYSEFVSVSG